MVVAEQQKKRLRLNSGFTFIELVIAIAIIGIIAALVGPAIYRRFAEAQLTGAVTTMKSLDSSIKLYKIHTGQFPNKLDDLIKKPANIQNWKGPYLEDIDEIPKTAWGEDYIYKAPTKGSQKFELYTTGQDGERIDAKTKI